MSRVAVTLHMAVAAAQYCIKPYLIRELRQADGDEPLLGGVERALGIQHVQVYVDALLVTGIGEPVGLRAGVHQGLPAVFDQKVLNRLKIIPVGDHRLLFGVLAYGGQAGPQYRKRPAPERMITSHRMIAAGQKERKRRSGNRRCSG